MAKRKAKLPKRIVGYKIPKAVRRNSGPIVKLLRTPQFKALIGTALAAAGAVAFAGDNADHGGKARRKTKIKRRLKFLRQEGMDRATEIADSVGRAVANALGQRASTKKEPAGSQGRGTTAH